MFCCKPASRGSVDTTDRGLDRPGGEEVLSSVPGVDAKDVKIEIHGNTLTISGEQNRVESKEISYRHRDFTKSMHRLWPQQFRAAASRSSQSLRKSPEGPTERTIPPGVCNTSGALRPLGASASPRQLF